MTERPFFFGNDATRLFGMLHEPEHGDSRLAFVMSHPFAEEKLWSHRVFVSFARALAQRGFATLRFDYRGAGDSSGETTQTSLSSHLADLAAAVEALREKCPKVERVGLVGLRLGASIAGLLTEQAARDGVPGCVRDAPLILWDPVLDGQAYFRDLLRSNLSTQLAVFGKVLESREVLEEKIRAGTPVNVDGYEIGEPLFASCASSDLFPIGARQHSGPTLVVQIAANEKVPAREDLQDLARSYARGQCARTTEQAFWREIRPFYAQAADLQQVTLQWLEQTGV